MIPVGEGPDAIAVGAGVVWVSGEFSQLIARIDPAENRVVERIPVANRPKGLALLDNQVWFAVQAVRRRPSRRAPGRRRQWIHRWAQIDP